MDQTPSRFPTRRVLIAGALAAWPVQALAQRRRVVTVLGDSITAGLGLPASAALPVQLQAQLRKLGTNALVRGAGVSGDTTAGGLARVDFSVQNDTDVCIVALGGNDLLQGVDPKRTKANLDKIVAKLRARKIAVVLAGLQPPPVIGRTYAREFQAVFPAVAKAHGALLYPNLLAGVAQVARLNQRDGFHPNAQGVIVIAQGLAPVVAGALKARA
ncbi:arylesterase [Phenylobacterium sp. Root700]|uniref:arylesterase n=1 Tax=Phenylobacterium sp. Root700 TaxID=1736591 RepID=UPI0006FD409A|nr:arylesterase [Phenylobacterium sp. Root700]KRB49605.1 acyl-CoA thioesterase [Phenylobacterium sp. Root700]